MVERILMNFLIAGALKTVECFWRGTDSPETFQAPPIEHFGAAENFLFSLDI